MDSKRKIISLGLIVAMLGTLVISNSAKAVDERLEVASDITRKILNVKVKDDQKKCGYVSSSYIKGLDDIEDYIVSQCATGGYAIFEKESMELIEYSAIGYSPYIGVESGNAYYGGPANYFKRKGEEIENLNTGKISKREIAEIQAKKLKKKLKVDREQRKNKSKEAKELKNSKGTSRLENLTSPGPTGDLLIDADSYMVESCKYIPKYQFFIDNHEHGENETGTCTTVAVQLLLAYNNWANDGRLIPANPKQGEEFLPPNRLIEGNSNLYTNLMIKTTSENIDNETLTFYECLLKYVDKNENGASLIKANSGIKAYIKDYAPIIENEITVTYDLSISENGKEYDYELLRKEIDNGRPAIAGMFVYDENEDGTYDKEGHAVVVYGYQTIRYNLQDLKGFIAHFGWHSDERDYTNIWFNENWAGGCLTFKTTHMHDDEKNLDVNNHIFECGECGAVYAKDDHTPGFIYKVEEIDPKFSAVHNVICECGYRYIELHSIQYIDNYDGVYHRRECAECGFYELEAHVFKYGDCHFCGALPQD